MKTESRATVLLITGLMGGFLVLLAVIAWFLDRDPNKFMAGAIVSITPNLVTFYYSNRPGQIPPTSVAEPALVPVSKPFRVPDSMAFSVLIVVLIGSMNFLIAIFDANIIDLHLDPVFPQLQAAVTGVVMLGHLLPLAAIGAYRIGYRPSAISFSSAFFAVALTMGSFAAIAAVNTIIHHDSALEDLMRALFRPTGSMPLSARDQTVFALLIIGSGLLAILIIGLWLGLWASWGNWRFRRTYRMQT